MSEREAKYKMSISLNVLNHLGLNLYSNTPAVLAEVIANSWDADATEVRVDFDIGGKVIRVSDDGTGMDVDDINEKYLRVGYQKREVDGNTTPDGRKPMGRKGIGKLSLFSIANSISVYTKKEETEGEAFRLDANKIKKAIQTEGSSSSDSSSAEQYEPELIDFAQEIDGQGTIIEIRDLKKVRLTAASVNGLRKKIARRFGLIADRENFKIIIDGQKVTFADRDYFHKAQFLYQYGDYDYSQHCNNLEENGKQNTRFARQGNFDTQGNLDSQGKYSITGWIAVAKKSSDLDDGPDNEDNLNKITILVRNKVAQEDILQEFRLGGMITKYLFGEIHADFLDSDDPNLEDCATSSRQRIKEDDPRYKALKSFVDSELRNIWKDTNKLKDRKGINVACELHPKIRKWFDSLSGDHKSAAKKLFGKINQLPIDVPDEKRRIFISSILAFESLKLRSLLHRLEDLTVENLPALETVFIQLDDLEASSYYNIVKQRIEVINKLTNLVDDDAREKALQKHLYNHLWLLDPSWERATSTARMETQIKNIIKEVDRSNDYEKYRVDIYYTTTGSKHVVVELKRTNRKLATSDLYNQLDKYRSQILKLLRKAGKDEPLEFICVIGEELQDWSDPEGKVTSEKILQALNARVVLYEQLIQNALEQYKDYLDNAKDVGITYQLIQSIDQDDVDEMNPASD